MKLFVRFLCVLAIVFLCDVLAGIWGRAYINDLSEYSFERAQKCNIVLHREADILIIGASKAKHNYITDRFFGNGLTAFNAGVDGSDCYLDFLILKACSSRKLPQIVIYDICENQIKGSPERRVGDFSFLYKQNPTADSVLDKELLPIEKIKMLSNLYKYNKLPETVVAKFHKKNKTGGGYVPEYGIFKDGDFIETNDFVPNAKEVSYLDEIVGFCVKQNVFLVISITPSCINNKAFAKWIEEYCENKNVCLINSNNLFWNQLELFVDDQHLNADGSSLFTDYFRGILDNSF